MTFNFRKSSFLLTLMVLITGLLIACDASSLDSSGRPVEELEPNPTELTPGQINDLAVIANGVEGFQLFFDPVHGMFVFNPEQPNLSSWRDLMEDNPENWHGIAELMEELMSIGFFADYPTIMLSPFDATLYWLRIEEGRIVYNVLD